MNWQDEKPLISNAEELKSAVTAMHNQQELLHNAIAAGIKSALGKKAQSKFKRWNDPKKIDDTVMKVWHFVSERTNPTVYSVVLKHCTDESKKAWKNALAVNPQLDTGHGVTLQEAVQFVSDGYAAGEKYRFCNVAFDTYNKLTVSEQRRLLEQSLKLSPDRSVNLAKIRSAMSRGIYRRAKHYGLDVDNCVTDALEDLRSKMMTEDKDTPGYALRKIPQGFALTTVFKKQAGSWASHNIPTRYALPPPPPDEDLGEDLDSDLRQFLEREGCLPEQAERVHHLYQFMVSQSDLPPPDKREVLGLFRREQGLTSEELTEASELLFQWLQERSSSQDGDDSHEW